MDLSAKYQQKTDKQHILDNPDTYIGSVEKIDSHQWVWHEDEKKIIEKQINYIPGLYKLFDEGIVNCRDHVIRMQQAVNNKVEKSLPVSNIDITIDNDGTITMFNDGNGIDVAMHPEYNIWIPELIFGHLRTSTNYNKEEKKIVGGKNGFGFKLVLIWSSYGSIETIDHIRGLKYKQEFKNNLDCIETPIITKCKGKPYTKIMFKPDYSRFGLEGLSEDVISLFKKRIYDIAAVTDKNLKVKCNSELIPIKNFSQYIDLFIGKKDENKRVIEQANDRWEYCVGLSMSHEFQQVSFVNGIHTLKGGRHVEYILNQITKKLGEYIEKKKKVKVNPNSIKEQIILFVRCDVENPSFDSQTKDYMNTPVSKFGSTAVVSEKFIEKIAKMGIMEAACALTEVKETKVAKKTDGSKSKNLRGIPKLVDANWAGTDKSGQCMLLLCEGDSAKAGIISGLSSSDRNTIGVYPLKGKVMNIRGETTKRINENKEISELKKIMGLESGKEYNSQEDINKKLRYGKILFMTDQDLDGSHIKGLCINLFQCTWPSLSKVPGFIGFMNTPILKAKKANQELKFYNDGEFEVWKKQVNDEYKSWNIKYYKGLGTSTGKEFKEYFEEKKIVGFNHSGEESDNAIDMVFNKKRADHRKDWLGLYNRELYLDTNSDNIKYEDFINRELIHFSKYDCDRSIPNLMDGLKISLRKILFSAFKKNLTSEIKVAQFTGYVSEHACYHHGEASLNQAIVGLAQNYVGSNNINLLVPSGQFGTRLQGGKDSASERYIFTYLNKLTRKIFPQADDQILNYLLDDGDQVEPQYYYPIIPMVLVNGTKGIGTGFSTEILCYNPKDIIDYLKNKLNGFEIDIDFVPFYKNFKGTIEKVQDKKFLFKGKYEKMGTDKIRVTELPIGHWTQDFKELLESLEENTDKNGKKITPIVKDYDDMSKDTTIDFTITFTKGKLDELENINLDNSCNGVHKVLKLMSNSSTTNMNLFNAEDKLVKYENVKDIIDDYYTSRYRGYEIRKQKIMEVLENQLLILRNKKKYVEYLLNDELDLRRKKKDVLVQELFDKGFDKLEEDNEYKYLLKMTMDSVTEENVDKLENEYKNKSDDLTKTKNKKINEMWLEELKDLESCYKEFIETQDSENPKIKKKIVKKK